jgi:hypothetical protein
MKRILPPAIYLSLAALAAGTAGAHAQSADLDALLSCRSLDEAAERLACFDAASAALAGVQAASGVAAAPAASENAEARREAEFGADDFRGSFEARRAAEKNGEAELTSIEVAVLEIGRTASGKALIILENGQVWRQIDSDGVYFRAPSSLDGVTAAISQGALGSYRMKLGKNRVIRVRRLR